jgi:hypothetical protein
MFDLAALPLPSASGYHGFNHEFMSALPQGICAPLHRAHAGLAPFMGRDCPISVLFAACGNLNFRGSGQVSWRPASQFERWASQGAVL